MRFFFLRIATCILFITGVVEHTYGGEGTRTFASIGVEEHLLKNGLKVFVKSNSEDAGDVFIKVYFDGGYAQEGSMKEKASAFISFLALYESVLENHEDRNLYQNYLDDPFEELRMYVLPTSRGIEARVSADFFEDFIVFLSWIFKHPEISTEGYAKAVNSISKKGKELSAKNKYNMIAKTYYEYFKGTHFSADSPMYVVHHFDRETAQKYVENSFSGDIPFKIVVVGDIGADKVKEAFEKHFPEKQQVPQKRKEPVLTDKWESPRSFMLKGNGAKESVSTVSYTVKMKGEPQEMPMFYATLNILEKRLRDKLKDNIGRKGVRLTPDFPYYPDGSLAFIQIKFNAHPMHNQAILTAIEREIHDLVRNGPTEKELKVALDSFARGGTLLCSDNYFWLCIISDYELSGWDLSHIQSRIKADPNITPVAIHEYLKRTLTTNAPLNVFME